MACLRIHVRKYHRPRNISRTAPQLLLDEIANTDQKYRDWGNSSKDVSDCEKRDFEAMGKIPDRQQRADKPSVKRHATAPSLKYLQWVGHIVTRLIKDDLTQPAAYESS